MKRSKIQKQIIFAISLFVILVVGCSSTSQSSSAPTSEPPAATTIAPSEPTATPSPLPPTETFTVIPPTLTETATLVPTETPTETPSRTATQAPPTAVVNQESGCRAGPSTAYGILAFLSAGDTGILDGRTEDDLWWRIQFPVVEESCWVFNDFLTQDADPALVAIITPVPLPTATVVAEEEKQGVKYFLMIPNTGGPFGCGDGIAYFYSNKKGKSSQEKIEFALNALFSVDSEFVGKYYNPLYRSTLRVRSVEIEGNLVTVKLTGKLIWSHDACDSKRIHDQVWETAGNYANGKHINIWVNNVPLGDLLENVK